MRRLFIVFVLCIVSLVAFCQKMDMSLFHGMQPRNIGPAGMSGRVTAIDVVLSDIDHIYIGAAAGGVWESKNNGHTWNPIFDNEKAASIGDIAIYQANPSIIYVGTGEGNPRNSQNSGRGMFKTMDGGKTWKHLGLENSRQIHRVLVHPNNPDVVWAGVSGATWGPSQDRGVYKTIDGGTTWKKVLYVNEYTGVSDLIIDPANPNKLMVGLWEHKRLPWRFKSGGAGSGLYISHDGGENWKKLSDKEGLPSGELGRIGLSIAPTNSDRIYAYVENESNAIYRSDDGGSEWQRVSQKGERNIGGRPFYYADIYVDSQNENRLYSIATEVTVSDDGGKSWKVFAPGNKIHTDHHAWWSHPEDNKHIIIGHDGGLNTTYDRGENWAFADNLPLAQFYHIRVDNEFPYHVMGGLQDNGSWRGPNRTWFKGGIRNMYWQRLSVGDGFDVVPDPLDPTRGYAMGQAGNLVNYHTISGQLKKIKPVHPEGTHLRFNWNSGIGISPINNKTIFYGSQFVHRSDDNGQTWKIISPDLTTNDPDKTKFLETGGLTYDVTGAENHCTIISIDPSPIDSNVIWVGTDDGNVQVTRDGGDTWQNTSKNLGGVPANAWVTQVTASLHDPSIAYVVIDDHRRNNWEPYVFVTSNYGATWKRITQSADIDGYVYCFVQDKEESDLMFVGSEFGLYVSFDGGRNWNKWSEGLPTMPISDLVIHPREGDLVIGTFGRAIWILDDIRPLRAMAANTIETNQSHLIDIPDEHVMIIGESIGYRQGKIGDAMYNGENRPYGALLSYWIDNDTVSTANILIKDADGQLVRTLTDDVSKGLNRINWRTNYDAVRRPDQKKPNANSSPRGGWYAPPGDYQVSLMAGKDTSTLWMKLSPDPRIDISSSEVKAKQRQISEYNNQVRRLTDIGDELRNFQNKLSLSKEILELNDIDQSDKAYEVLDSVKKRISLFDAKFFGQKDKQGIYRDPAVMTSQLRQVGYLLDHPLSPVTNNQNTALQNLMTAVIKKEEEWKELRQYCTEQLEQVNKDLRIRLE